MYEKRIIIEANPSSNVTLGPIEDFTDHPVFKWWPPDDIGSTTTNPKVIIGTDDPGVFGTELIHEYALLQRAAELRGVNIHRIERWLQGFRRAGLTLSFFPDSIKRDRIL